jgi:hypothetical protein
MASFAPTYTARYRAHYVAAGIQHTMQFRLQRGQSESEVQIGGSLACGVVAVGLQDLLPLDWAWLSAEYAMEDSEVFLPTTTLPSAPIPDVAITNLSAVERITSTTFAGKGLAGRARVSIWCPDWPEDTVDGKGSRGIITAAEDSAIEDVVNGLNGLSNQPVTNGNEVAIWYGRATIKRNDHLLKLVRRGLAG